MMPMTPSPTTPTGTPPTARLPSDPPPGWRSRHHQRRRPIRMMARKRAQQRWSALLARIAKQMRLDAPLWADFVAHANATYKAAFVAAFAVPRIVCVGPSDGGPCGFHVDLASADAFRTLGLMHLDHEQDLVITCDMWKRALPAQPTAWDAGVDRALLGHLLFGVADDAAHGPAMLRFRCGPGASHCHKLSMPHYRALRDVATLSIDVGGD